MVARMPLLLVFMKFLQSKNFKAKNRHGTSTEPQRGEGSPLDADF